MIEVSHLCKEFRLTRRLRREMGPSYQHLRALRAVEDVSFRCRPGRVLGLIGPNGAGKTTTLRLVATMLKPTSGTITVAGYDTQTASQKVRERIGFMTGQTALYDRLTPLEMVRYIADLHALDPELFRQRQERLFTLLDMQEFAGRRVGRLSSGMKQKVSIVRTIIHDPEVMVFDEPTTGLDVMTSRRIIELIRTCREEGKTVLFSTHRMEEIKQLCDDIALIHQGKLFFKGSLGDFERQMQADTYEDEFIRLVGVT